jgi:hypothetical protein
MRGSKKLVYESISDMCGAVK